MNISIIIPNFNGEKLLHKNLPHVLDSVKDYRKGTVEIIIANDPSTDNSQDVIDQFIKSIHSSHITGKTIVNTKKTESGFSKNVNRGVSIATGDILVLLNTDVRPHKEFLDPLLAHFSDDKVFAVGCLDESVEHGEKVLRGRGIGFWARGFLHHRAGVVSKHNSLWASGGSSAFRKSMLDKLGGLDALYNPFYWEDIDLSYRALKAGYEIRFEPKSVVVHEHEEGAIKTKFKPKYIQKIAYRNQIIFVWKNITDRSLLFSHILWLPYHILRALLKNDMPFIQGLMQATTHIDQIKHARFKSKKLFTKNDRTVLKENKD